MKATRKSRAESPGAVPGWQKREVYPHISYASTGWERNATLPNATVKEEQSPARANAGIENHLERQPCMVDIVLHSDLEADDEELYTLEKIDMLGVLSSTQAVMEQGEYAWINMDQLALLSEQWVHTESVAPATWYERHHFNDGSQRTANWILALDAMNFCFWSENGAPRWTIHYEGEKLNGYMAEAAALKRAVDEQIPLWDAGFLSNLSSEELASIFRGEREDIPIPLFEQRLENAREVGRVLLEYYEGQFTRMIEQAGGSATKLALSLTQRFSSFNDIARYRGKLVRFYKRAQICVADLRGAFKAEGWGAFDDYEQLTAFADYKLPQVLRHHGVLEYAPALAERIDKQEALPAGSDEEIEIRAATIWACELLRREMSVHGYNLTAADIDQHLWFLGQEAANMKPYHRTRTAFY